MSLAAVADPADLSAYRASAQEQARVRDLMSMVPEGTRSALDIGARDGYLSRRLAAKCEQVTALDLECPTFSADRVTCVRGNATALAFGDRAFDGVLCAEVLEHIPDVDRAARELGRVTARWLIVGVPYRQDIRFGRTTCAHCGAKNPPWGHVNSFDEDRVARLFPEFTVARVGFVGRTRDATNGLSAALMDYAGNPYGTYTQDEPCVACGQRLRPPPPRSFAQKVATRVAFSLQRAQTQLTPWRGNWLHVLLQRRQ